MHAGETSESSEECVIIGVSVQIFQRSDLPANDTKGYCSAHLTGHEDGWYNYEIVSTAEDDTENSAE